MNYNVIFKSRKFDNFLKENKLLFIVKSHSIPAFKDEFDRDMKNLKVYEKTADVYPLFKYIDLLITDYSSIYMDFLHLNRPVLYYVFDLVEYKRDSRTIQFDFDEMTPGPKVENFEELMKMIKHFLIDKNDGFEKKRKRIRNLAFKYKDGKSSERIYKELINTTKQRLG
jgi:CDP-glycerol glycerophosphotransferase